MSRVEFLEAVLWAMCHVPCGIAALQEPPPNSRPSQSRSARLQWAQPLSLPGVRMDLRLLKLKHVQPKKKKENSCIPRRGLVRQEAVVEPWGKLEHSSGCRWKA